MGVAVCTTRLAAGATIGFGGGFFDLAAVDQCCSGDVGRLRLALRYQAFAMMVVGGADLGGQASHVGGAGVLKAPCGLVLGRRG